MGDQTRPAPWLVYGALLAFLTFTAIIFATSVYSLFRPNDLLDRYLWGWAEYVIVAILVVGVTLNARIERYLSGLGAPTALQKPRSKEIANEQTKLTANFLNSIAVAVIAGAAIAPLASEFAKGSVFTVLAGLLLGVLIHITARIMIRQCHRS